MIGVQLHTYVEARLGRWSVWMRWGARSGPREVQSWWAKMVLEPNVEQTGRASPVCPVDESEAVLTMKAVLALEPDLRQTVHEAYLRGGTVEQKCRALGIRSRQTFYDRLARANTVLLGYMQDLEVGIPLPEPKALEKPRRRAA